MRELFEPLAGRPIGRRPGRAHGVRPRPSPQPVLEAAGRDHGRQLRALPRRARSCSSRTRATGPHVLALPPVHIAVMGMERVVAELADLAVLLPLLTRSGTGQKITSYVTLSSGPRRGDERDGPEEMHVVILDNGRSRVRETRYASVLHCIRCGACQNVCPVYRQVGGTRLRLGVRRPDRRRVHSAPRGRARPASWAMHRRCAPPATTSARSRFRCTSCCSACAATGPPSRRDARAARFRLWSFAWSRPRLYRLTVRLAGRARGPLPLLRRWTRTRDLEVHR